MIMSRRVKTSAMNRRSLPSPEIPHYPLDSGLNILARLIARHILTNRSQSGDESVAKSNYSEPDNLMLQRRDEND
jgi:hypothetical protein